MIIRIVLYEEEDGWEKESNCEFEVVNGERARNQEEDRLEVILHRDQLFQLVVAVHDWIEVIEKGFRLC